MRDRQLGTTDLRVSPLGLGCNNFGGRLDPAAARSVVHAALDAGITVFDTADIYGMRGGSESILGEALGSRRKDVVLVTKFGLAMDDEVRAAIYLYLVDLLSKEDKFVPVSEDAESMKYMEINA